MKIVGSEVIAIDGEARCGKTTLMDAITRHSGALRGLGERAAAALRETHDGPERAESVQKILNFGDMARFDTVEQISAGNFFRAAAAYVIDLERLGKTKDSFDPRDTAVIEKLMASDEGKEMLQNDPAVGKRVSRIAQRNGVQALCGTLFANAVQEAYLLGDGANLVLADARNPAACLRRNNLLGTAPHQIHPASIVPIYIDTPAVVAAQRIKGDYEENLRIVLERRHDDRTRAELPVTPPTSDEVITDFGAYRAQFGDPNRADVALPYLLDNGAESSLARIEYMGILLAHVASDAGLMRPYVQTAS